MKDILDRITANEALEIIRQLAESDKGIKKRITTIAEEIIKEIDVEAVSDDVFFYLDGIDVHELWDNSGSRSDGYISPEEMAVEMIEEVLEPFNQEAMRLFDLNMSEEANLYCMGVLKGIYRFDHESKSEFKDWSVDVPGECFSYLFNEWEKRCKDTKEIKEMNSFLEKECSEWI